MKAKDKNNIYVHILVDKDLNDLLKVELKNNDLTLTEITKEFWRLLVNKSPYVDKIVQIYVQEKEKRLLDTLEEKVYMKHKRKTYEDNKAEREYERTMDFKKMRNSRSSKVIDLDKLYDVMEKEKKEDSNNKKSKK